MAETPRFTISREFRAPLVKVWEAWTKAEALAQWFGPKGTSSEMLVFDLRPGGEWRGRTVMPDGSDMFSKFVFREVEPMKRLAWVHGFADAEGNRIRAPFAPQFPLELLTVVEFADSIDSTRVDLSWQPLDATSEEEACFAAMMASMNGGWTMSFDQLEEFLA